MGVRVLIVGALAAETLPILGALSEGRPCLRVPRLVTGLLRGIPVGVLTCGVGPTAAARRLAAALAHGPCQDAHLLVSVGTCGALADDLAIGTVLTASSLTDEAGRPCPPPLPWPGPCRPAALVSVDRPIWSPHDRALLAANGHEACEMEAAALQRSLPPSPPSSRLSFSTLKVVSDRAGADPGADPPDHPSASDILRFQKRALHLSATYLLPALLRGLPPPDGSS